MLDEKIGEPAALELLAEECTELAQAALKLARKERGENPTPKIMGDCIKAVMEEWVDVILVLGELADLEWNNSDVFQEIYNAKYSRMMRRLQKSCFAEKYGIAQKWRDPSQEVPGDKQDVLVTVYDSICERHEVCMAAWFDDEGWVLDYANEGDFTVVAWMPLPAPATDVGRKTCKITMR